MQKVYDSDVLGFGEIFNEEEPKANESYMKNKKHIFTEIKTKINVHVQIKASNKTMKPIIIGK
ncbi:Ger(x)C family spore germination C-terminal domain-containing protein [Clostridium lacusfryxellense]|nr:Ger(x)C family spore germination C-terminal domain-containing protein [Clostridium lacusfryxellense]